MTLFEQFLIMAAIICSFSGCATVSMDRVQDTQTVSAVSESSYNDSDSNIQATFYFEYDKYDLSASAMSEIKELAKSIQLNSTKIRIEGHCDERGTREYNLALGEKRAMAVSEFLQVNGVSSNNITTVSYGEERPIAYGSNESSWSKNRRSIIKTID